MPTAKNEETGMWTDMSDDADFMAAKVADGIDVHIVAWCDLTRRPMRVRCLRALPIRMR